MVQGLEDSPSSFATVASLKGVCKTVAAVSLARFKLDEGDDLSSREVEVNAPPSATAPLGRGSNNPRRTD